MKSYWLENKSLNLKRWLNTEKVTTGEPGDPTASHKPEWELFPHFTHPEMVYSIVDRMNERGGGLAASGDSALGQRTTKGGKKRVPGIGMYCHKYGDI